MTVSDILDHFDSQQSPLFVDQRLTNDFPGYVRTVSLRRDCVVLIEYEQYGYDEGGASFYGSYPDYSAAVRAVEKYLGVSLDRWSALDIRAYPPPPSEMLDTATGTRALASAIAAQTLPLPEGTVFELRGSSFWSQATE